MALLLSSCTKVVDIDMEKPDPKLVINGFLNPDSSFAVHVSKSQFLFDNKMLQDITDAKVSVYEGETKLGDLEHQEQGYYHLAGIYPQEGKEYTLRAESQGIEPVSVTEKALSISNIKELTSESLPGNYGNTIRLRYNITLDDPAGEKNYYIFKAYEQGTYPDYNEGEIVGEVHYKTSMWLESRDPNLEVIWMNGSFFLLADTYFDGKIYEVRLTDVNSTSGWGSDEDGYNKFAYLTVYHISEATYLYYKTLDKNFYGEDPFSEPLKVYSNIKGGYGIWAPMAGKTIKADL